MGRCLFRVVFLGSLLFAVSGCEIKSVTSQVALPALNITCSGNACMASTSSGVVSEPAVLDLSTTTGQMELIRYFYVLVNGPVSGRSLPTGTTAHLETVNNFSDVLGSMLKSSGYETCASIPSSGTLIKKSAGVEYTMTMSTGTKAIPNHFGTGGGTTFSKRITVERESVSVMIMELSCSAEQSTLKSGYFLFNAGASEKQYEAYFQYDSSTAAGYLDFFLSDESGTKGEKVAARFITNDGNVYRFWLIQSFLNSTKATYIGVHGNRTLGQAAIRIRKADKTDVVSLTANSGTYYSSCIHPANNALSVACTDLGLRVIDPVVTTHMPSTGSAFLWNISAAASLTMSSIE